MRRSGSWRSRASWRSSTARRPRAGCGSRGRWRRGSRSSVLVLALDSSTGAVTVAVGRAEEGAGREVIAEVSVACRGASEALLLAAHDALGLAGTSLGEVERILVGARSLSFAIGASLSRNSTLAALAAPTLLSAEEPDVIAVLDAKRRQVFAQRFAEDETRGGILCVEPEQLPAEPTTGDAPLVVGDGAVRYREALSALGRVPPDASPLHRVTAAGHLLSADLSPVPASEVVPLYVREPDAEVRRDLNPWSRA